MTSDQLADQLVQHFNDLDDKPVEYQAIKPDEIAAADKERSDWGVFVIPYSESEEPLDRGDMCREELTLSVVVNGPVSVQLSRAKGNGLVRFLRDSLRESEFDGHRWAGNEVVMLYDAEALKLKSQFLSLFRATYFTFA